MLYTVEAASKMLLTLPKFPPIVKGWNRLEGRPRTVDFSRALRAEVRDALWFLTRQWQFGEFQGEDTGSPIDARIVIRATPLQHYAAAGGGAVGYDATVPLETRVEREEIPSDLLLHVQVSRYFFGRAASISGFSSVRVAVLGRYPLTSATLEGVADQDVDAVLSLAAARTLDGVKLLEEIASGAYAAFVGGFAGTLTAAAITDLTNAGTELIEWFHRLYSVPAATEEGAWTERFQEYQLACAAQGAAGPQTVLEADEYASGHLDWYAFDVDNAPGAALVRPDPVMLPGVAGRPLSFLPAPVSFSGMPNARYWEMENRKTEFADIDANTTDLAKLLLTEFALVYSNDWCVIPYEVEVGTVCEVAGLIVTDDFGEQILIRAAGRSPETTWQRWSMFTLTSTDPAQQADVRLFVPPAVTKMMEGAPIEKVIFLRDEMANMVWAVERIVPSNAGAGVDGYQYVPAVAAPTGPPMHATKAKVRYVLGTDVPPNWIPFIPVHVSGSNRSVQLQRARMPQGSAPHGRILVGAQPYYVNEEEVPRAGKIVTRTFQRARWLDGRTFVWLGRRASTGKGEGSSGLVFDQVVDVTTAR
jgi:hypothetical protein